MALIMHMGYSAMHTSNSLAMSVGKTQESGNPLFLTGKATHAKCLAHHCHQTGQWYGRYLRHREQGCREDTDLNSSLGLVDAFCLKRSLSEV